MDKKEIAMYIIAIILGVFLGKLLADMLIVTAFRSLIEIFI